MGKDKTSPDSIATIAQYARPAQDYIANVSGKVTILGYSSGGRVISYVMEQLPDKIEKAVFLAASMPVSGRIYPTFDPTNIPSGLGTFYYGNGPDNPPTSFLLSPIYAPSIFYNASPKEDITLALSLLTPHPLGPFRPALTLTLERYGRVRRFYIRTSRDQAADPSFQRDTIESNPPERVFDIDSDHSSFFSKPDELTSILEEISCL